MTAAETPALARAYKEFGTADPGFYVYLLWTDEKCVYVGMVGAKGPRRPMDRIREHATQQSWWPEVTRVEITECASRDSAFREERTRIGTLRPVFNKPQGAQAAAAKPPPFPGRFYVPQPTHVRWEPAQCGPGGTLHIGEASIRLPAKPADSPELYVATAEFRRAFEDMVASDYGKWAVPAMNAAKEKIKDLCV
jgi:hypothetical protein